LDDAALAVLLHVRHPTIRKANRGTSLSEQERERERKRERERERERERQRESGRGPS
jgi:hypothetical protein